ncbi:MAG: hypothetical protein NZ893_03300, partial [Candidatus Aenigmarchaeota archaeon]|nr:hypothetical protein [Candidatus Aenigmarchaeota archaeon]
MANKRQKKSEKNRSEADKKAKDAKQKRKRAFKDKKKAKKETAKTKKETIEKILEGIKEIEYSSKIRKIAEKEPHIEPILTQKEFQSVIPSAEESQQELEKVSYSLPSKEIPSIKTLPTVKKPAKIEKLKIIKTGIPGFDEMCGGGIEEKSIVLVNGDAGSGKTIFGLQFLYEGAKNGEAGLFISFGESREAIYSRMLNFGMDFQKLEEKNLFFFLEYQPHEVAKIMQEEGGTLYDLITAYNIKRVVVDTITPYLMQFSDAYKARLALVRLFSVFKKFSVTTLLLNEWSQNLPSNPSTAVAEFLADGIVYLIHKRSSEGVQIRGIEIWKMTGVSH